MSWEIGYDTKWNRDVGYGVPATCDHPGCTARIDRGLDYICGGRPFGGETGCGLFFCHEHLLVGERCQQCQRCAEGRPPFSPSLDVPDWAKWKLADPSWAAWREENPGEVRVLELAVTPA